MTAEATNPARAVRPVVALAGIVAVVAGVLHQAWWGMTFAALALAVGWFASKRADTPGAGRFALFIGGSGALLVLGLAVASFSEYLLYPADGVAFPWPWPDALSAIRLLGFAFQIGGLLGLAAALALLYRRDVRARLVPALTLLCLGLFGLTVVFGQLWGSAIVELAALAAGAGALGSTTGRSRLLRIAVGAQAADLATFGTVWSMGGEVNPLGEWLMLALFGATPQHSLSWQAVVVPAILLILAKLGLIAYLMTIEARLGRYRTFVLLLAAAVGGVAMAANLFARAAW